MYGSSPTHIFSMWSSLAFMEAASRPFPESHILSICSIQLWLISIAECSCKPQTWRPTSQISPQWIQPIILSDCSSLEHNTAGTQLPLGGPIYCQVRRPHRLMLSVKTTAALTGIQEFYAPFLPPACGSEQLSNYQEILCNYILQRSLTLREINTTRRNSIAPTASIIVSTWQMSWRQQCGSDMHSCLLLESRRRVSLGLTSLCRHPKWLVLADTSESIDLDKCSGI